MVTEQWTVLSEDFFFMNDISVSLPIAKIYWKYSQLKKYSGSGIGFELKSGIRICDFGFTALRCPHSYIIDLILCPSAIQLTDVQRLGAVRSDLCERLVLVDGVPHAGCTADRDDGLLLRLLHCPLLPARLPAPLPHPHREQPAQVRCQRRRRNCEISH